MTTELSPGGIYYRSTANKGRGSVNLNSGTSDYTKSEARAEAGSFPGLLDGEVHAWVECGDEVTPTEDGTLDIEIEGEYATELTSSGTSCRTQFQTIVYNLSDDEPVTNTEIFDKTYTWKRRFHSDSYSNSMTANLESGKNYLVGVRADTWATGAGSFASIADADPAGTYNGYHQYNSLQMFY